MDERFEGEWKFLYKTIYERAEVRADRALLEMATQLRVLDDAEKLSEYFSQVKPRPLGTVVQGDGTMTDLHFRDLTNKIMHAAVFKWRLTEEPSVVCYPHDPGRWQSAEIKIIALMAFVGQLMV